MLYTYNGYEDNINSFNKFLNFIEHNLNDNNLKYEKFRIKYKDIYIKLSFLSKIKLFKYYENLNTNEKDIIFNFMKLFLLHLFISLNIEFSDFYEQLIMNEFRNLKAIFNLIYPYLDDKDNMFNQKNFKGIKDLIEKKKNNIPIFSNYLYDHNYIKDMGIEYEYKLFVHLDINVKNSIGNYKIFNYYYCIFYFLFDIVEKIKYKYYINWINTFPLTLENYKNSNLFKNSFKYNEINDTFQYENIDYIFFKIFSVPIHSSIDIDYILNSLKNEKIYNGDEDKIRIFILEFLDIQRYEIFFYQGLNLEDIYNTLVNDYFLTIKNSKWLLYEGLINDDIYIYIDLFDLILDLTNIINNKNWNILDDNSKNIFEKNWKLFILSIKKRENIIKNRNNKEIIINNEIKDLLLKYFIIFFQKNNLNIHILIKEGKFKKINIDKDIDENEGKYITEDIYDFINSIIETPIEEIYNFLLNDIHIFKNSVYENTLFYYENDIIKLKNFNYKKLKVNKTTNTINIKNKDIIISPKFYYNFGKSLNFINGEQVYNLWDSLSIENKLIILLRLTIKKDLIDEKSWFNIRKNLDKIYKPNEILYVRKLIYKKIRSEIIDLTFLNLIKKGCICEFKYNPKLSDFNLLGTKYNEKKKNFKKNFDNYFNKNLIDEYKEAYYFVNNKKYKDQIKIKINEKNQYNNFIEYIKDNKNTGDNWNTFYAMDWVCQIDFYLKFINHRVLYVTGSTGQGKSTQVPKLYLYGLKSLLYKNNGKIICTVPRIDPILENSKNISKSMGIPIENYNENFKKNTRTDNDIIQYQYSSDYHKSNSNFFLRLVTDGTLLTILKENQILKKKYKSNNFNHIYNDINEYDVIMIDEAHEHNANMDIILTIMRHTLLYNNDIKLSIISATMEDDEKIFRKYYRFIDDNLIYPINISNFFLNLDRNLIDRRFHISPPGETTQHKVIEYYENNSIDNYDNNEKLAIKKVIKLFNTTKSGEILLFSTTQNNIYNIINKLHKIIPSNCIALPYYSELKNEFKDISKYPRLNLKKIDYHRDDMLDYFKGNKKYIDLKKVQSGTYLRACIIATNAAEASLTIDSLKYVVDIGYQFNVIYNYDKKLIETSPGKINESSRKQRKGRVGRVAPGEVYHMYPINSRLNVKTSFNISTINFNENYINLLSDDFNVDNEIINNKIMFKLLTHKKIDKDDIPQNLDKDKNLNVEEYLKSNKLINILYNQYKLEDIFYNNNQNKFINFNYGSFDKSFNQLSEYLFPTYHDGFGNKLLLDISGYFYIISPLELEVNRDEYSSNYFKNNRKYTIDLLSIKKIYYSSLINCDLIKLIKSKEIFKNIILKYFNSIQSKLNTYDSKYSKSICLSFMLDLINNNMINEDYSNDIIFDNFKFKTLNFTIFLNKILENINYDFKNLIIKNKINKFIILNKNNISDIIFFIKIFNIILKYINLVKIKNDINNKFINVKNLFNQINDNKYLNISYDDYNLIKKLILNGNLTEDSLKETINVNELEYSLNEIMIKKICDNNFIDYDIIIKSIKQYINEIYKLSSNNINFNLNIKKINNILKFSYDEKLINNIINIKLYLNMENIYYVNNNQIINLFNNKINYESINLINKSKLGLFLNLNTNNNKINILSNINKLSIFQIFPYILDNINIEYINYYDLNQNLFYLFKKYISDNESNIFNLKIKENIYNIKYS